MPHPKVSVIVPVYNAARFLPRCLESLLGQTYKNLEIICVDDGSSDDSLAVLKEYAAKDARIKVIHQENAGVSAARNRGLDVATGEYLTFADADDWVESWGYERVVSCFTDEVDAVCFGVSVDGLLQTSHHKSLKSFLQIPFEGEVSVDMLSEISLNGCIWNKIWKRSILEKKLVRFFEEISFGEDECYTYCSFGIMHKLKLIKDKIYHYVQHSDSAMSNVVQQNNRRSKDAIRGLRYMLDFYLKNGSYDRMKLIFLRRFRDCYAFVYTLSDAREKKLFLQESLRILRDGKLTNRKEYWEVREILRMNQKNIERVFCQYIGNRVCYGIDRLHLMSITYGEDTIIYRILGRIVYTRRNKAKQPC